ncbi:MAG TPA: cupin domain-containing protein [Jiangellaceae bacterium]
MTGFPGGTSVSHLRVYDWPTADGLRGGSPHVHTVSAEGYVVLRGTGLLETLSGAGYEEHELAAGRVLWFSPGTVHRLVNSGGDLEIVVVMQNSGLPEAGDAVFTFPPGVLADHERYRKAAALPASDDDAVLAEAARTRRDLAIEGYLPLRDRVRAGDFTALDDLHRAAAGIVQDLVPRWRELWRQRPLAQAAATGDHLDALGAGQAGHLAAAAVATAGGPAAKYGMCGHLTTWNLH